MEAILAIAAIALVTIQAHRNYLMVKASRKSYSPVIYNECKPQVEAQHIVVPAPVVKIDNNSSLDIDYAKLSLAIANAIQVNQPPTPVLRPVVIPSGLPSPTWVMDAQQHTNESIVEVAGKDVVVKTFPMRNQ